MNKNNQKVSKTVKNSQKVTKTYYHKHTHIHIHTHTHTILYTYTYTYYTIHILPYHTHTHTTIHIPYYTILYHTIHILSYSYTYYTIIPYTYYTHTHNPNLLLSPHHVAIISYVKSEFEHCCDTTRPALLNAVPSGCSPITMFCSTSAIPGAELAGTDSLTAPPRSLRRFIWSITDCVRLI